MVLNGLLVKAKHQPWEQQSNDCGCASSSGRTQTLQFKAVTLRAAPQWLPDPDLKFVSATLLCGEGLQLLSVQCFSPHADPWFWGSSAHYLTGPGWSGLGIVVLSLETTSANFFSRLVVIALKTWVASLPPNVSGKHLGQWAAHHTPLARCCSM